MAGITRTNGKKLRARRAWVITAAVAGFLLVVSAIVFAVSSGTRRVTEHAQALHLADESLRQSTVVQFQLVFAAHLAAVEREFGSDTSDQVAEQLDQAEIGLASLRGGLDQLAQLGGRVDENLRVAFGGYIEAADATVTAVKTGDFLAADLLAKTTLRDRYEVFFNSMLAEREFQLNEVEESDRVVGRMGDIARFLTALVIPLAIILIYREVVRRQQRNAELEVRLSAEREVGKARDDFVANASHEFRTPLTSIYGLSQLLEEDPGIPEEAREMAGMISTEASDLSRMVEDLLTTARLEAGALTFHQEQIMTHEEVEDVVRPFNRGGMTIETDVSPAVVRADRLRQRQVLRNLLSNARKYGGAQIKVTGRKDGDWFVWTVADDGDGIPAELEARLFERFIHQGTTIVVPGGVGLGLSIVKALAEGMGGTVGYRRVDGWTNFELRVRLAAPSATEHASVTPSVSAGAFEVAASNPYKGSDRREV